MIYEDDHWQSARLRGEEGQTSRESAGTNDRTDDTLSVVKLRLAGASKGAICSADLLAGLSFSANNDAPKGERSICFDPATIPVYRGSIKSLQ